MPTFSKNQRRLITEHLKTQYLECAFSAHPDDAMAVAWHELERLFNSHNMQDDRNHGIDPYTGEPIK